MQTVSQPDAIQPAQAEAASIQLPCLITQDDDRQMIPLKRLVKSPYNQRIKPPTGIEAFADNIAAQGLLQNLVVHPMKVGAKKAQTFGVAGGGRRLAALTLLVGRGVITGDFPVPCKVISVEEAILASATENDMREPSHPADQFIAYQTLIDSGRSAEFIAAFYGIGTQTVARRLKLANVSPKLMELFRNDGIELEQMQALAVTDDHEAQEAAWFGAVQDWQRTPHNLRSRLVSDRLTLRDACVRLVGVEAYEAAGGVVERDLFSDEGAAYIVNRPLLMQLFNDRMADHVEALKASGWSWVEARPALDHMELHSFTRLDATPVALTPDEQQRLDALNARFAELDARRDAYYEADEGEEGDMPEAAFEALENEIEEVSEGIEALEDREGAYTPEQMSVSGAIVHVNRDGSLAVYGGLVRTEQKAEARALIEETGGPVPKSLTKKEKGVHSEKLLMRLTAHRTAAVQSELAMNPHVALAALVHTLAARLILGGYQPSSAVQIAASDCKFRLKNAAPELETADTSVGLREYAKSWRAQFPKDGAQVFGWLLEQSDERLMNLLALCTALSVDGVVGNEQPHAINAIAGALNLDLSAHWQPTRENYLDHVSKDRIAAVVSSVVSPDEGKRLAKMKKGDAAAEAQKLLEGRNWLPEFMAAAEVRSNVIEAVSDDGDDDTVAVEPDVNETMAAQANGAVPVESAIAASEGNPAPWPFPKAADFERPADDQPDQCVVAGTTGAATSAVNDVPASRVPAPAWPFPTARLRGHEPVAHAA
ncbi:ParB N-terminal domain-containing protein (plasmid) [Burkholderia thailandensis]|nr:ParB/RepB/Spo0J family partition protein [Burkholderia thailandensis]QRA15174.1 ParB N-terminal domain-containing protein [Burkholderia thailandensis]